MDSQESDEVGLFDVMAAIDTGILCSGIRRRYLCNRESIQFGKRAQCVFKGNRRRTAEAIIDSERCGRDGIVPVVVYEKEMPGVHSVRQ
jgi:hypothetical protein